MTDKWTRTKHWPPRWPVGLFWAVWIPAYTIFVGFPVGTIGATAGAAVSLAVMYLLHRRTLRGYRRTAQANLHSRPGNDPGFGAIYRALTAAGVTPDEIAGLTTEQAIERAGPGLEAEPVTAWRLCQIVFDRGKFRFAGISYMQMYGVEATASCVMGDWRHAGAAIIEECSCGFYSVIKRHDLPGRADGNIVMVAVEVYGIVLVHEKGYRSEKQRVMRVEAHRYIPKCGHPRPLDEWKVGISSVGGWAGEDQWINAWPMCEAAAVAVNPTTGRLACKYHADLAQLEHPDVDLEYVIDWRDRITRDLPTEWVWR